MHNEIMAVMHNEIMDSESIKQSSAHQIGFSPHLNCNNLTIKPISLLYKMADFSF